MRDYDKAIDWFRDVLGFQLLEDRPLGGAKRWVRMAPDPAAATAFLLARATGDQRSAIGRAAGGRVAYFLEVGDFAAQYRRLAARGVRFEDAPRIRACGTVAVFRDLYGNRWDLIGPATGGQAPGPI